MASTSPRNEIVEQANAGTFVASVTEEIQEPSEKSTDVHGGNSSGGDFSRNIFVDLEEDTDNENYGDKKEEDKETDESVGRSSLHTSDRGLCGLFSCPRQKERA